MSAMHLTVRSAIVFTSSSVVAMGRTPRRALDSNLTSAAFLAASGSRSASARLFFTAASLLPAPLRRPRRKRVLWSHRPQSASTASSWRSNAPVRVRR